MTEYTETAALASQLAVYAHEVETVSKALVEQGNRLTVQGAGGYADVHLDEYLETIAERLGQLQHNVESMRGYTRTAVERQNREALRS